MTQFSARNIAFIAITFVLIILSLHEKLYTFIVIQDLVQSVTSILLCVHYYLTTSNND